MLAAYPWALSIGWRLPLLEPPGDVAFEMDIVRVKIPDGALRAQVQIFQLHPEYGWGHGAVDVIDLVGHIDGADPVGLWCMRAS